MAEAGLLRRPTGSGRIAHVAALDGVRGIAVIAVVIYHLDPGVLPGGFLGVSLFFTLSGFLITNLLVAEWRDSGTIDLRSFWNRRFRRLLPASVAGIALVVVLSPAWTARQLSALPGDVAGALGYVANWRFIAAGDRYGAGFEAPSPLLHYWSLAIEEQFYLLVGALTVFVTAGRSLRRWAVMFGVLGGASVVATLVLYDPLRSDRVYFGSLTRAAELVAGVVLALAIGFEVPERLQRWSQRVGLVSAAAAGLAFVLVELTDDALYRGGFWLMALVSAGIIGGALTDGPLQRVLSWRPLTAIGLVSYGIYVYHWPLVLWLNAARIGIDGWTLAAVRLAATAAITIVSFVWLERPIREARVSGRSLLMGAVGASVLLVGAAWTLAQDADARAVAGDAPAVSLPSSTLTSSLDPSLDEAAPTVEPEPGVVGSPTTTTTTTTTGPEPLGRVLMMGDSLLHQAYPTIEDRLSRIGVGATIIGGPSETLMTRQATWLDDLERSVTEYDPDVVILESCCGTGNPWLPDPYVDADGTDSNRTQRRSGPSGSGLRSCTPKPLSDGARLSSGFLDPPQTPTATTARSRTGSAWSIASIPGSPRAREASASSTGVWSAGPIRTMSRRFPMRMGSSSGCGPMMVCTSPSLARRSSPT